ncbi:MAG: (2Fe-2S)-binding protein [Silvanigrellales bacterium]|jgi:ferredoxin|nr:(2Fe-2S)-binding protein [Silvanigrellales bacterium]
MSESNPRPSFSVVAPSNAQVVTVRCVGKSGSTVREFSMRGGLNLWVFLRKHGVPVGAACSGVGVCAACHVTVSPGGNVSPANEFEQESLRRHGHDPQSQRLACLCRVWGDVTVSADYW